MNRRPLFVLATSLLSLLPINAHSEHVVVTSDTLVDVFPLYVGNQWTYSYNNVSVEWPGGNPYQDVTDTGHARYVVSGTTLFADSTIWHFILYRDLTRHFHQWLQSLDTTYAIHDTSDFDLTESLSGQHAIYRSIEPSSVHDDVFAFRPDFADTTRIYRFREVGLGDTTTFLSWLQPAPGPAFQNTYTFKKTVGLIRNSYNSGTVDLFSTHEYTLLDYTITSVARGTNILPTISCSLYQNYPNPFNPSTSISFFTAARQRVNLKVFDLLGREVAVLLDGIVNAGYKSIIWNATNLPSGVYFCQLRIAGSVQTKRLLLIK